MLVSENGNNTANEILNFSINDSGLTFTDDSHTVDSQSQSCWGYWQDYHYPYVISNSYPVYIQERSLDKGKQAFEIIKVLKDKKMVQLKKVSDFIDLMDALIKIL